MQSAASPPLRHVAYGVADLQAAPVDGPEQSEQTEDDGQDPRRVDAFGVPGLLPGSHLT